MTRIHHLLRKVEEALRTAPSKGAVLEEATEEALRDLGAVEVHRQHAGTQFGFDIYARMPSNAGGIEIWKLECKNLKDPIGMNEIAPKLIWHTASTTIDRFVIVGPSQPANDLLHFLETHPYAFPISLWTGESLLRLLASSKGALAKLGIKSSVGAATSAMPDSPVYVPSGPISFDVVHTASPPAQFAYLRPYGAGVVKAFTSAHFTLNAFLGNRASDDGTVTGLRCRTVRHAPLADRRVLIQTKAKGLFVPEKTTYRPVPEAAGEVDVLDGRMMRVVGKQLEVLRIALDWQAAPGFYEVQFVGEARTARAAQSIASLVFPLFVPGGGEDSAQMLVVGRHHDEIAERVLTYRNKAWRQFKAGERSVQIDVDMEQLARDSMARVLGKWEPSGWLSEQLGRRQHAPAGAGDTLEANLKDSVRNGDEA